MFTSVFSFFVSVAGFTTVVSFFCSGGFTTLVLLSFFSAGGFVTVVSFCSQATRKARPARRQIYFFIQMNRIAAPRVTPLSLKIKDIKGGAQFLTTVSLWRTDAQPKHFAEVASIQVMVTATRRPAG